MDSAFEEEDDDMAHEPMSLTQHSCDIDAAIRHLRDSVCRARATGYKATFYIIPEGEYDHPQVGVRLSEEDGSLESAIWIGMPVPPGEDC